MIWGKGGGKSEMASFFPGEGLLKFISSARWPFEVYFSRIMRMYGKSSEVIPHLIFGFFENVTTKSSSLYS